MEILVYVFQLPAATAYVRATDERSARAILERTCYRGAPVASWPFVGTRSVEALEERGLWP